MSRKLNETYFKGPIVCEWLEKYRSQESQTSVKNQKRVFIGRFPVRPNDSSLLKKWKSGQGATLGSVDSLLNYYGLMLEDFERWAAEYHPDYILQHAQTCG